MAVVYGKERAALGQYFVQYFIRHKKALFGFLLFKCGDFFEIVRKGGQKRQIGADVFFAAEGILRQKDRKLRLNAQRLSQRFLIVIISFGQKLSFQPPVQNAGGQTVFVVQPPLEIAGKL